MRLLTLNTWQGRLFRNFAPFFDEQQADIICLQELNSSLEPTGDWQETFCSLQAIQKASELENQYFSPTYGYEIMGVEVKFGNGMLSRYPLTSQETFFTHSSYVKIVKPGDHVHNARNAQIATVHSPKGNLTVVNTHAHWEKDPMGSKLSFQRLEKLRQVLENIQGPIIVAGDFNLRSESEALQSFKKALKLKDLTMDYGITNTLNNLVTPYEVACDHIFINDYIKVTDYKLSDDLLSDHKALILDFDL